jgi:hypothetical protein
MSVILTVEDETLVSAYLGQVLTDAGYHVMAAANADEAIEILEARDDIRIVITDVHVPGSRMGFGWQRRSRTAGRQSRSSSPAVRLPPGTTRCQGTVSSCQSRMRRIRFWRRSDSFNRYINGTLDVKGMIPGFTDDVKPSDRNACPKANQAYATLSRLHHHCGWRA